MFFSAELLSKRDSGFGLLWLAATLGSKSSFKKLPKQSIRTADIPQLCDQISRPPEPLALRLSSNLMIGVARVYKIKHEFFVADVSNCFALVRKTIQEIHALDAANDAQITMAHPTVRADVVTLTTDPTIALALEFDTFEASWDDIAEIATQRRRTADDDDDDFALQNGRNKAKGKAKASDVAVEGARGAALHTLDEHHEHLLLSTSFDGNASFGGIDPSSSQIEPGMNFGSFTMEDNMFDGGNGNGLDMGFDLGIGEDLARELGEGWGANPEAVAGANEALLDQDMNFDIGPDMMDFQMDDMPLMLLNDNGPEHSASASLKSKSPGSARKRMASDSDKENRPPTNDEERAMTPSALSEGFQPLAIEMPHGAEDGAVDVPELQGASPQKPAPFRTTRKAKRVRILMDETTELTDEELRSAREKYLERQLAIRDEIERKRTEKESNKLFEDMIWGAPHGLDIPVLSEFWTSRFKVQVEARSGVVHLKEKEEPSRKRRKTAHTPAGNDTQPPEGNNNDLQLANEDVVPITGDYGFDYMQDMDAPMMDIDMGEPARLRSSEEPERGRNASRPPSVLAFDPEALNPSSGTQRSAFFPWDNAAGTSSTNGGAFVPLGSGSDRLSIDKADTQIRLPRSSLSVSAAGGGGGSFMMPQSQSGSVTGLNFGVSPDRVGPRGSDDFQFDVTNDFPTGTIQDTQDTEMTLVTLEKTSYNFLEYCKIQLQSLPGMQSSISFDDIVCPTTSTKRVAAAALYHCLVLSTKNLVSVEQERPYEQISIRIK